jgi:hypothetical protein
MPSNKSGKRDWRHDELPESDKAGLLTGWLAILLESWPARRQAYKMKCQQVGKKELQKATIQDSNPVSWPAGWQANKMVR